MVALLSVVVFLLVATAHCFNYGNATVPPASVLQYIPLKDVYPSPRYGAAMGIVQQTDYYGFVMLGGSMAYGDDNHGWLYKVDSNQTVWKSLKTEFAISSACYVQDKDYLYIYGGTHAGTNTNLYQYQISKDTMVTVDIKGTSPPTQGATCAFRNDTLYIVGGDCTSQVHMYDTKAKTAEWVNITVPAPANAGRKGASGLLFGDEFVLWGGNCKGDQDTDVLRFNLATKSWSTDKATSQGPDARSYHSAVVNTITADPSFIVFGGEVDKQTMNDTWVYNLTAKNWTRVNPVIDPNAKWEFFSSRQSSNVAYVLGRMFIFSGLVSTNSTANDFWELVITSDCYQLTDSCGACVVTDGCGWCADNTKGFQCVPGYNNMPYINGSCFKPADTDTPYTNDLCPPEGFPGWIIALIIVITILAIGVVWYFVIRCQKKSSGYDQIN